MRPEKKPPDSTQALSKGRPGCQLHSYHYKHPRASCLRAPALELPGPGLESELHQFPCTFPELEGNTEPPRSSFLIRNGVEEKREWEGDVPGFSAPGTECQSIGTPSLPVGHRPAALLQARLASCPHVSFLILPPLLTITMVVHPPGMTIWHCLPCCLRSGYRILWSTWSGAAWMPAGPFPFRYMLFRACGWCLQPCGDCPWAPGTVSPAHSKGQTRLGHGDLASAPFAEYPKPDRLVWGGKAHTLSGSGHLRGVAYIAESPPQVSGGRCPHGLLPEVTFLPGFLLFPSCILQAPAAPSNSSLLLHSPDTGILVAGSVGEPS